MTNGDIPYRDLVDMSFHDMLRALAVEYNKVSVENGQLRAECKRLRSHGVVMSSPLEQIPRSGSRSFESLPPAEERPEAKKAAAAPVPGQDRTPAAQLPERGEGKSVPEDGRGEGVRKPSPEEYPFESPSSDLVRDDESRHHALDDGGRSRSSASLFMLSPEKDAGTWSNGPGLSKRDEGGKSTETIQSKDGPKGAEVVPGTLRIRRMVSLVSAMGALSSEGSRKNAQGYNLADIARFGRPFRKNTARNRMTLNDALRGANMKMQRSNQWVVNPDRSKFLLKWDQVTILALAFVAVVTPMQVAMMDTKLDALFVVNVCVDLVFFFDMILQFFLMYPVKTNYGVAFEHRQVMIIKNYLQGWFLIDLASIVPFDLISIMSDSEGGFQKAKAVKVIRLLRLLKLARMCKVSRLFRRLEMRMAIAYQRLALAKFLTMLILVTHWMANLWALTLVLVDEEDQVPRWVDSFNDLETNIEAKTKDTIWKLYLTCLYFTSYTITSVGYGDIGPANIIERMVCTLMILVSGITWALLIAQVCSIVSSMDAEEQNFRKIMDDLNVMMDDKELPSSMRRRLRSFFLSNKSAARANRHQKIVESMSPALRGEVCLEMNRMWITKVSFLKAFLIEAASAQDEHLRMQTFMVDVSRSLQTEVYAQGEPFGRAQELYILNRGLASHTGKVRRSGAVWGTDFVLSNTALLEPYGSFALTYVEVTFLQREYFLKMVEQHKVDCPEISKIVRRYCGWLAFQRMILLEASKRRRPSLQTLPIRELGNLKTMGRAAPW